MIIFPYDNALRPFDGTLPHALSIHLGPYKEVLENCIISSSIRKKETKLKWFEYRRLARAKLRTELNIIVPQIATHPHFAVASHQVAFKEKAQAIVLKDMYDAAFTAGIAGLLNSSFVADYLRRECFSKRESDQPEKDTYFEFSGKKLENIPIPSMVESDNELWAMLRKLAARCDDFGARVVGCAARTLFQSASPYAVAVSQKAFASAADLSRNWTDSIRDRETMLGTMIALQEEIDWAAYAAYDVLPGQHPAVQVELEPEPLDRKQRVFWIWAQAAGDYDRAVAQIPPEFSTARCDLWKARLATIRDTEVVRRIEQAIYKRRWDEQWKVGNQWRCGEIAYTGEFIDAFEWWLKEKAEWWLEKAKKGGPANLGEWTVAMWQDERVKSAWMLAADNYVSIENEKAREKAERNGDSEPSPRLADASFRGFDKRFRQLIDEESVPFGFEFGTPYDALAKKLKKPIPAKLQKLRGKLNVPRERFHEVDKDVYQWAGLQFKEKQGKAVASTTAKR